MMRPVLRLRRCFGVVFALFLFQISAGIATEVKVVASDRSLARQSDDKREKIEPWSERFFAQIEQEYGQEAVVRLRRVHDAAIANASRPVLDKLKIANATINSLTWVSDREMWGKDDYWATPLEIIAKAGGDCEDMAIAKFVMLRMMGVPVRNLYLGYARLKSQNMAHMILVWANDARKEVRVLDNFDPIVKPPRERMDLQIVYLNDAQGRVILIEDNGKTRRIKAELGERKMEKLEELKKRIQETRTKYAEYNDGRSLFSDQK